MHMADALLSPSVGCTAWAAAAGAIACCSRHVRKRLDDRKVPLMGVLGAFIFAVQMINFTIPGTGSSGHLGGGLLLAILLGPQAAFLTIASVLVIQALFFADGGLLALGCNILNLGFFPAFVAYPLVYRKLLRGGEGRMSVTLAAVPAAVVGLQLGALGVVLETVLSGVSQLPFSKFLLVMLPIHLVIGVVEGGVTAAVVTFVCKARPEVLGGGTEAVPTGRYSLRHLLVGFLCGALITGGIVARFASKEPDGLEWAVARVAGSGGLASPQGGMHAGLAALQGKTALMPDYAFKKTEEAKAGGALKGEDSRLGSSVPGIVGGLLTMALAALVGFVLKRRGGKG